MIEPQELVIPSSAGLDASALRVAGGAGLHVLLGRNNAGKTRILELLVQAGFGAKVVMADVKPARKFGHAMLDAEWSGMGVVRVTWPRDLEPPSNLNYLLKHVPGGIHIDDTSTAALRAAKPGLEGDVWRYVQGELWPSLRRRRAVLVPTNRYFAQSAPLSAELNYADPASWSATLGNLERGDPAERAAFKGLTAAFSDITEGLRVLSLGKGGVSAIHIAEDGAPERPIDDCGDGLRDLVGILLFAFSYPDHDLMLDDPGLRLHADAQRRLLAFLDEQARHRAIWVATHEALFIAAPQVVRRFYVQRTKGRDESVVEELLDRNALKEAQSRLGWIPADAFFADHVLMCEGPSDKIAFQAVVGWIAEKDVRKGGALVTDLGGEGVVWERGDELKRRIELMRGIAAHATHSVLVDRGGKSERQVETLRKNVAAAGARLELLKRNELENYWLTPPVVSEILAALAAEATAIRGEAVSAPPHDTLVKALASYDHANEKGSAVLEEIAKTAQLRYDKRQGALVAVGVLRRLAEAEARELQEAVEAALG